MKKEIFNTITAQLDNTLDNCKKLVGDLSVDEQVLTKEMLANYSYAELKSKVTSARAILSFTDKIFKDELYHIIGMGNMTANQTMIVVKKVREICEYRCYIKCIASINLPELPEVPNTANYMCKALGVKLHNTLNK